MRPWFLIKGKRINYFYYFSGVFSAVLTLKSQGAFKKLHEVKPWPFLFHREPHTQPSCLTHYALSLFCVVMHRVFLYFKYSPSTVSLMVFTNGESFLGQGIVNLVNSERLVSQGNRPSGGRAGWFCKGGELL